MAETYYTKYNKVLKRGRIMKIKKLVVSLGVAITFILALVVSLVANFSTPKPTYNAGNEDIVTNDTNVSVNNEKPKTIVYNSQDVVLRTGTNNLNYSYTPDVNATDETPEVVAYEYRFGNPNSYKMAVGLSSIDSESVNISYMYSDSKLDLSGDLTTYTKFKTQAINTGAGHKYIYVFITPKNGSIPADFTTTLYWNLGTAGEVRVVNPDSSVTTETIIRGQQVDVSEFEEKAPNNYKTVYYYDAACTIPAIFPLKGTGQQLYAQFECTGNLPSDWIAWDEYSSSYNMIDPYGYYYVCDDIYDDNGEWIGFNEYLAPSNSGPFSKLPEDLYIPEKYDDGVHGEAYITAIPYGCMDYYETNYFSFLTYENVTSITILAPITEIPYWSFSNLDSLTTVKIKNGANLTTIYGTAFYGCSNLTSVDLSNCTSLTTIDGYAFYDCSNLTSIDLSTCTSLTTIYSSAFYNCTSLTSITLPTSLTTIYSSAFERCFSLGIVYNLSGLTITAGSSSNGYVAYYAYVVKTSLDTTNKFETINGVNYYKDSNTSYIALGLADTSLTSITLHANTTAIKYKAFADCKTLTSVNLSNSTSLTSIRSYAFNSCTNLTSVTLPSSLTTIEIFAFAGCRSLTTITLPSSLTTIGSSAFSGCYALGVVYNLSSLTITAGANTNGYVAYYAYVVKTSLGNSDIETIGGVNYYKESSTSYIALGLADTRLTSITLHAKTTVIRPYAFYNRDNLTSIDFSNCVNLTSIGSSAFYDCEGLTSITLPSSLTTIGSSAFYDCSKLTSIDFSNCTNLTTIGSNAFYNCDSLTSIDLSNCTKLTTIESYAFIYCNNLTSIVIPASVTSIGTSAFYGCYALGVVYNLSSLAITAGNTGNGYVAYYAYIVKTSLDNSDIETIEGVSYYKESDTSYIALGLVDTSLTNITLHANTTQIKPYAFYNNETLTNVNLSNCTKLTTIERYVFYNCNGLTSITLPSSLTTISDEVFCGCSSLTSITLPSGLTKIGEKAFYGCVSLTSITIPARVKTIGHGAFKGLSNSSIIFEQTSGWYQVFSSSESGTKVDVTENSSFLYTLSSENGIFYFLYNTNEGGNNTDCPEIII